MIRGAFFILATFALFNFGLSVECSNKSNITEWSLYIVCWSRSQLSHDNCQWDVVEITANARVQSLKTSPSPGQLNCPGKFSLPLSTGEYSYRLLFLPSETWHFVLNLRVEDPGELTVKNCAHEVSEGDNVTCLCSTKREGNPPPVISWAGETSSTLHLYKVRGEHSKTYTCEMMWGKQTKTVSYSLLVRVSDEKDEQDETSSTSVNLIVLTSATAAAVLVIIIVVTVIVTVIIRAKKRRETPQRGLQSQRPWSDSGHGEDELVENRYYGGFQIDRRRDLNNGGNDYVEMGDVISTELDLYAGIEENNERQTTEPVRCAKANKGRQPIQPELYATVVKFSGKEQATKDNSKLHEKKDFSNEGDVYAMVDKGAKPKRHLVSAPVEELYAQVVKSPK
ncbi:uncharacterized protein LOC112568679 isoform X2 [Pomacea canaliculata]|uniref:uncharacterized protein LOC112568679 isoform X2 n=1 Tax=Pomacea canaliculata TaxID=400727 RepID=UPI000D73F437|nr:uncharacterized protein LOC112568679 isoform X2 [Pomacea canaliculata]